MALSAFYELEGTPLENWFADFLSRDLAFEHYYRSPGQIALTNLNPAFESGHNLEIDGILRIHKTCILLEYTAQHGQFRDKIKKFIRNCHLFVNDDHLNLRQKFQLFGIPLQGGDSGKKVGVHDF
jgi:hypothetical protein